MKRIVEVKRVYITRVAVADATREEAFDAAIKAVENDDNWDVFDIDSMDFDGFHYEVVSDDEEGDIEVNKEGEVIYE